MVQSELRALVVGTGFGCRIQIPALRAAGFDVVGLIGSDPSRTSQRAAVNGIPSAFTDLDQAIRETRATAVAISTPPHTHAQLSLAAISRGCHVICEKPFASNTAEAKAVLQAAEQAKLVHVVGHEFRWAPQRAMFARLLGQGAIGRPTLATFVSLLPYLIGPGVDMPDWWFDDEAGGGWLGASGSHMIDWLCMLVGDFRTVSASLQTLRRDRNGADDTFTLRFTTASGVEGLLQQSAATWGAPLDAARIVGTKGAIWLEGQEVKLADADGTRSVPVAEDLVLPPMPPLGPDPRHRTPKWQMLVNIELPPYIRLCEAFRARIEGTSAPAGPALPTFADGVASMEMIDAIRASAANGGALVRVGRYAA